MDKTKVGVFSPNDPRPWVRSENLELMLEHERALLEALRKEGVEVIRGYNCNPLSAELEEEPNPTRLKSFGSGVTIARDMRRDHRRRHNSS